MARSIIHIVIIVEKIRRRKYFVRLIFVALCDHENFSTMKISRFTVPFIIARHYPTQNQADDFYMDYCLTSLYQQTPLHAAAKNHHDYTVQHLIENGADVNIKDNNGVSM